MKSEAPTPFYQFPLSEKRVELLRSGDTLLIPDIVIWIALLGVELPYDVMTETQTQDDSRFNTAIAQGEWRPLQCVILGNLEQACSVRVDTYTLPEQVYRRLDAEKKHHAYQAITLQHNDLLHPPNFPVEKQFAIQFKRFFTRK